MAKWIRTQKGSLVNLDLVCRLYIAQGYKDEISELRAEFPNTAEGLPDYTVIFSENGEHAKEMCRGVLGEIQEYLCSQESGVFSPSPIGKAAQHD